MSNFSQELCRLCNDSNRPKIDILDDEIPGYDIQDIIYHFFSFKILSTDKLPTSICNDCLKHLKDFYKFYTKVKQVQLDFVSNIKDKSRKRKKKIKVHHTDHSVMDTSILHSSFVHSLISTNSSEISNPIIKKEDPLESQLNFTGDVYDEPLNSPLDSDVSVKEELIYDMPEDIKMMKKEHVSEFVENSIVNLMNIDKEDVDGRIADISISNPVRSASSSAALFDYNSADEMSLEGFPEYICKDGRLVVTGSDLDILLGKFFKIHCEMCNGKPRYPTLFLLFQHYTTDHNTRGYVTCCGKQLKKRVNVVDHMISHVWPNSYQCHHCDRVFPAQKCLTMHLKRHLPDSEKKYKCDKCERGFVSFANLSTHKMSHIPPEEIESFDCKECNKTFKGKFSLDNHIRSSHRFKIFLCPTCGKKCKTKTALKLHLSTHDLVNREIFPCEECGARYRTPTGLIIHKKKHLTERIQCTLCDYNTYHTSGLKSHMKHKHSDEKPFACHQCEKSFKLKKTLTDHMAQHTGHHKYSCTFCYKTFASSGNCYSHRKRMHPEELKDMLKEKQIHKHPEEIVTQIERSVR